MRRRRLLAHLGVVSGSLSLAGCSMGSFGSEPEAGTDTETETGTEARRTTTERTATTAPTPHPKYDQCPGKPTREDALGAPLQIQEPSDERYFYDGDRDGPPTEFVQRQCVIEYRDRFEAEVTDRGGRLLPISVTPRTGEDGTVLEALLEFEFSQDGHVENVPPIGYDEYRELVPESISAEITVNGERIDCEVPVKVGCTELVAA